MSEDGRSESIPDSAQIWHYTSFPALLSIVQKSKLWFTTLAVLEDPLEGRSDRWYKRLADKADEELARRGTVHCWHIGEEESDLMWKAYAPAFGVAIESTVSKLEGSFCGPEKGKVRCHQVDCGTLSREPDAFRKRRHFDGEREFRAYLPHEAVCSKYLPESEAAGIAEYIISTGRYVEIDPNTLIEAI